MKNFYANTKIITCYFLLLLWSLSLVGSIGCISIPKKTQIAIAYEAMGIALEVAKPAILTLCANDTFTAEDCVKAKTAYNQAVAVYEALAYVKGAEYRDLVTTLLKLLEVLNQFLITQNTVEAFSITSDGLNGVTYIDETSKGGN